MGGVDLNSIRWAVHCWAHRRDGAPRKRWAIHSDSVCPKHGGASPQARRKARERLIEATAYRILAAWEYDGGVIAVRYIGPDPFA